jgi:glycosyltransferase involved in cell wall biosynthesis
LNIQRPIIFSFLIPAYNPDPKWLGESIESCLCQMIAAPFEIIVVDDGSDKPIVPMIGGNRISDDRIHVVRIPHGGVAKALNAGLEHCHGEFIARLDADDMAAPPRLGKQWKAMENFDLVGGSMNAVRAKSEIVAIMPEPKWDDAKARLLDKRILCYHPTWMIRASTLRDVGGYPVEYPHAEDYALQCKLVMAGKRIKNIADLCTYYRRHDKQMSKLHRDEQMESTERAMKEILLCEPTSSIPPMTDTGSKASDAPTSSPNTASSATESPSTAAQAAQATTTQAGCASASSEPLSSPKKPKSTKK